MHALSMSMLVVSLAARLRLNTTLAYYLALTTIALFSEEPQSKVYAVEGAEGRCM